ncbi:Flp pilus assembly protein CpaB [Spongiibacter tropicus]|uniref:Flp pilus assembly protein CpaB n=1 Tax=Spongiibacter tropicus TaxID=454602 RepID=UPI0035BE1BCD
MQARTLKIIAALLIISAVVMGVIGYRISQEDAQRQVQRQAAATAANSYTYAQKLMIATRDIRKGEQLTEEDLMQVPYAITVEGSFNTPAELINRRSERDIFKGAVIRTTDFEDDSELATQIRPGHRAIAVKVDEVIGTGGFLKPGDYVDVIFNSRASKETNDKSMARRVLRNIRLIAYGAEIEGESQMSTEGDNKAANKDTGKRSRSAVLEVAIDDINILVLAEHNGDLRLSAIGEADVLALEEGEQLPGDAAEDKATLMRAVTGFKPAPPPKSVYVYNGDKVETIRVSQ